MMCDTCGKIGMWGNNVSHSKRHTRTRFMPNIHKIKQPAKDVTMRKVSICTRCLRTKHKLPRT